MVISYTHIVISQQCAADEDEGCIEEVFVHKHIEKVKAVERLPLTQVLGPLCTIRKQ